MQGRLQGDSGGEHGLGPHFNCSPDVGSKFQQRVLLSGNMGREGINPRETPKHSRELSPLSRWKMKFVAGSQVRALESQETGKSQEITQRFKRIPVKKLGSDQLSVYKAECFPGDGRLDLIHVGCTGKGTLPAQQPRAGISHAADPWEALHPTPCSPLGKVGARVSRLSSSRTSSQLIANSMEEVV